MYIDVGRPMRLIKKAIAVLAALALMAGLLAACGDEDTLTTKTATTNPAATSTTAGETKPAKPPVDADGWPKDKVSALIPKPGFGSVIGASLPKAGVSVISLKNVAEKDFETYITLLKKEGFDRNTQETTGDSIRNFRAGDKVGTQVELVYSVENKIVLITIKSGS